MLKQLRTPLFDSQSPYVDRFGLLLVVTITALVVQSLYDMNTVSGTGDTSFGSVLLAGFVGLTVILALRASGVSKFWQRIADGVVIVFLSLMLFVLVIDMTSDVDVSTFARTWPPVIRALLVSLAPIAVIRRVASHRRVRAGTLLGAVSAYLLIALAFSYVFVSIGAVQSEPFFGQPESSTRFTYFSLVTMTTLGYGDLAPASNLASLAAASEAVIGQIFLVTFVGLLVGERIAARRIKS